VLNTPLKEAIKGKTAALKPKKIGKTVRVLQEYSLESASIAQ
jgi:hypothetical protein